MNAAPTAHPPLRSLLPHLLLPVLMGAIMALAYLGGFHKPEPHHLPVAVVGQAETAGPVAAAIQQKLGDAVDVTTVPDETAARDALKHLTISGAFVPGTKEATLLTVPAASDTTDTVVQRIFRGVAEQQGVHLTVKPVVALGEDDPSGQNAFFFLVALSVGSYATSIAIGAAAGKRRFRDRLLLGGGAAVVISTVYLLIAAGMYGMFPGHVAAVWALSLVYTAAVLSIGIGLHPVVGRLCTLIYSSLFVALNFTSSGGVFAPAMQPGLFGWLNQFWIGSGYVDAVRRVVSFPDVSLARPLWILFGWLAAGAVCLLIGFAAERRRAALEREVSTRVEREVSERVATEHLSERDAARTGAHAAPTSGHRALTRLEEDVEEELEENVAV